MDIRDLSVSLWRKGCFDSVPDLARYIKEHYGMFHYTKFDSMRRYIQRCITRSEADTEIITENVRLAKRDQKSKDKNRVQNKSFREYARIENAVEEYAKAIVEQLRKYGKGLAGNMNLKPLGIKKGGIGVGHITDAHLNELVSTANNKYDFNIASKRLKKQMSESIAYFEFRGVKAVVLVFTGDLLNSDRRIDELMMMATNRSKASVLAAHLFTQCILDLAQYYTVNVVSVLGNESRVNKEMAFSNDVISDNYDFTILSMCKIAIESSGVKNVHFQEIDKMETTINLGEQQWLVAHDVSKYTDKQKDTQASIGRAYLEGKPADFIIGGHIHAFRGTDLSCRPGSLVGSNDYNRHALNLFSKASGVCYVAQGKDIFYQYIDLQNTDGIEGYEIEEELEAYNAKSLSKTRKTTTVVEIVV